MLDRMDVDRAALHDDAGTFFESAGSAWLKLTPKAAAEACARATEFGFLVVRVEGGKWHAPGFEARADCIWDGIDPPCEAEQSHENSRRAAAFIEMEARTHQAFILTVAPITGYGHSHKNAI